MPIASSTASFARVGSPHAGERGDDVAADEERDDHHLGLVEPAVVGVERFRREAEVAGEDAQDRVAVGAAGEVAHDERRGDAQRADHDVGDDADAVDRRQRQVALA